MFGLFETKTRWIRLRRLLVFLALLMLASHSSQSASAFEQHTAHGGPVKGLAVSPDGRWMVSTSFDYTAVLWSVRDFSEVRTLVGHQAAVNAAAFSPDGRYLVTAGDDRTIRVWRLQDLLNETIEPVSRVVSGHTAKVVHLAFSADGRRLASSSWDHRVGLWSVPAFENQGFLSGHDAPVQAAYFSNDGLSLYSAGGDGHIRLWDVLEARYLRSLVNNGWGINVLAIDEDGDLLAYGTANGTMRIASLSGARPAVDHVSEGPPVLSLALDAATKRVAFGNSEGRVVIANAGSGDVERDFRAVMGPVWGMILVPGQEAVVLAGLDDFVTRIAFDAPNVTKVIESLADRRFHPLGKLDNGARQFARKCSVCHSLEADGKRRAGPTLHGVFGRKAGVLSGYPYSPALIDTGLVWNEETIDALFKDGPDVVTPGSKMPIQRIKNPVDRQDLIDFLKTAAGHAGLR
jgi:cytochrome c